MPTAPALEQKAHLPCAHARTFANAEGHAHIHFESAELHFLSACGACGVDSPAILPPNMFSLYAASRMTHGWICIYVVYRSKFMILSFVCINAVCFPHSQGIYITGRAGLWMQMCLVCAIYSFLRTARSTFLMQIDFEMTFIAQGFHMEVHSSGRAREKKLNEMSTTPVTAKFICWCGDGL